MTDPIPISSLTQYEYCPRRCYLIFIAGEFVDNRYTVEGSIVHERVHDDERTKRGDLIQTRRVYLYSKIHNMAGFADLIEEKKDEVYPVEYKRGRLSQWKNDRLQLCGQALCLEEMLGKSVPRGYIYFASSGRRNEVIFDDALRQLTIAIIDKVRELFTNAAAPDTEFSNRCNGCSLKPICLPRETKVLKDRIGAGIR